MNKYKLIILTALVTLTALGTQPALSSPLVNEIRLPTGAIQPQAAVDAQGAVHLLYFSGDPMHGDLFYMKRAPGRASNFSQPLRVNSAPGSVVAMGTIRGGQISLGAGGAVFVMWNGSDKTPATENASILFSRLNSARNGFEPQRNLLNERVFLDGGGSIASDGDGNVYVFWHAVPLSSKDEAAGRVYMSVSHDGGSTFQHERAIDQASHGACGCCSMKALVNPSGAIYVLYRAADRNTGRDSTLLTSLDNGRSFSTTILQKTQLSSCPMSMFALGNGASGTFAGWETVGTVSFASLSNPSAPVLANSRGANKFPTIAINSAGDIVCAWTEGGGWNQGGTAWWQVYDHNTRRFAAPVSRPGIKTWSYSSVVAQPDGTFLLFY